MYDLSALLLTGRPSDGLADVLSSQQQSVSLNRWETSMSDALVKIRDYCDRRIAPACQRLLVLLQDVRGWAALYARRQNVSISLLTMIISDRTNLHHSNATSP